jgi:SNF family Na+-dependent transporter
MPILIVLIVGLGLFSSAMGDVGATLRFLFRLDPAHLTLNAALDALGLGFFSIGVGLSQINGRHTLPVAADLHERLMRRAILDVVVQHHRQTGHA